jgi:predicted amidohydrolase
MSTSSPTTDTGGMKHRIAVAQMQSSSSKLNNLRWIAHCAGEAQRRGACMLFLPENCGFMGSSMLETLQNGERYELGDTSRQGGKTASPEQFEISDTLDKVMQDSLSSSSFSVMATMVASDAQKQLLPQTSADVAPLPATSSLSESSTSSPLHIDNSDISLIETLRFIAFKTGLWLSVGGVHVHTETGDSDRVYNVHLIIDNRGQIQAVYRKLHLFDVSIPGKVNLKESATTSPGRKVVVCETPIGTCS